MWSVVLRRWRDLEQVDERCPLGGGRWRGWARRRGAPARLPSALARAFCCTEFRAVVHSFLCSGNDRRAL